MFKDQANKRKIYWAIVVAIVLLIPVTLILVYGEPETSKNTVTIEKTFNVPDLADQPKDTLVSEGILPIHSWYTDNGIKVMFVPTEKLPIIDIDVSIEAGSSRDGEQKGIANLAAKLLDQGTEDMPEGAYEIATIFEGAGAIYETDVTKDRTRVLLRSLNDNDRLPEVIDLFSKVIATPSFHPSHVDRVKNQTLVEIEYNMQHPENIVRDQFYKTLYNEHPYAHPIEGLKETVEDITTRDLLDFHKKYYVAQNATITIVGGVHRDKAKEIANKIASQLKSGTKASELPSVPEVKKSVEKNVHFLVNQAYIILGTPGISVLDPDKYSLLVGNYILGASPFTSKLFNEIRVKKGLAYSVYSGFIMMEQPGPFLAKLETENSQSGEAIAMLKNIVSEFVKKGPTEKELKKAKKQLTGGFSLDISSNKKILEAVSALGFYNLPYNYFDNFVENINAVTLENVKEAFSRKINPDKMVQVVVSGNA